MLNLIQHLAETLKQVQGDKITAMTEQLRQYRNEGAGLGRITATPGVFL